MTNEYNPDGKEIRFIDSHYKDLFHIPDGSCVQIHYPDEMVVKPCTFIDEYHTQIGYNVFHICQFAEIMERNGASYMPEPEIMGDEAAWKVGKDRILAVQTCEDGYDYTLLDENYNEIDGGQVDNPELSMLEVRRDILESFGLERRELRAMFYEDVMEQAFEVGRQAVVVNDPIAELAFKLDRFAENFDPYYEIISGHRRKYAAEKLGYKKIPVIICMLQDDEAVVIMVDFNLQREQITPSEKAYAYKMKYDAIKKRQAERIVVKLTTIQEREVLM